MNEQYPTFIVPKATPMHAQLANAILQRNQIITTYDNETIHLYENGYYKPGSDTKIKEKIQKMLTEQTKNTIVTETIEYIRRCTYIEREKTENQPSYYINLKNGVFDLRNETLLPHTPGFGFTSQIPHNYNPKNFKCPKIRKAIAEWVGKENVGLAIQMIAYSLWRENTIQKAFMLVGCGRNGKSTYIDLLTKFLGEENVSNIELQMLEEDRFASAGLAGKHANCFADLPSRALKGTGIFKSVTGKDRIRGEEKYVKQWFFRPFAKIYFSANQVPRTNDDTDAFYRRWILLVFPFNFEGSKDKKNILEELTQENEMEGLLFVCLKVLKQLIKQGCFDRQQSVDDVRRLYQKLSDPIGSFLFDCVEADPGSKISKQKLYQAFQDYCMENKYPISSEKTFSIVLQKSMRVGEVYATETMEDLMKKRVWFWEAIKLKIDEKNSVKDVNGSGETELTDSLKFVFC